MFFTTSSFAYIVVWSPLFFCVLSGLFYSDVFFFKGRGKKRLSTFFFVEKLL